MNNKQEEKVYEASIFDEMGSNFTDSWLKTYDSMHRLWKNMAVSWKFNGKSASDDNTGYSFWSKNLFDILEQSKEVSQPQFGVDVLSRAFNAQGILFPVISFWADVIGDLQNLAKSPSEETKSTEVYQRWMNRYKSILEEHLAIPVSDSTDQALKSWFKVLQTNQRSLGILMNPWIEYAKNLQSNADGLVSGDLSSIAYIKKLWDKSYNQTFGRIFRAPAFGLTKAQTESLKRTFDAINQFWNSLPEFNQYIYKAGMEAYKDVFNQITKMNIEEITPDTLRKVYKVWWVTNENRFYDLFKNDEFIRSMNEVLRYGLTLKQRIDNLNIEWCKMLSIPTNRDFDEVAETIQDLRRRIRNQENKFEELQIQMNSTKTT